MKIEKVSDNQIRCTLTKEDLESRQLKLSELAYGTDKARHLFQEMIEKASYEFGFDAEDIPLMVEAVPLGKESILLIVTKVEYPEELDTRFSRFTPDVDGATDSDMSDAIPQAAAADDIISLFAKAKEAAAKYAKSAEAGLPDGDETSSVPVDITKLFCFHSLETLIRLAHVLGDFYQGKNALYKNPQDDWYYLVVSKSNHSPEEFNKVCNILTEYGMQANFSAGQESYFKEHYKVILPAKALATLAQL